VHKTPQHPHKREALAPESPGSHRIQRPKFISPAHNLSSTTDVVQLRPAKEGVSVHVIESNETYRLLRCLRTSEKRTQCGEEISFFHSSLEKQMKKCAMVVVVVKKKEQAVLNEEEEESWP
jgi:hypothetical protein